MASKSQKFNASVNFGATVDPSMTRTLNRLTSGIDKIGTETAQVNRVQTAWQRQMKAGAASTTNQLKHMERATQSLISKQESLEKEIRDSVKNGRAGTAFLIEDYKKVGQAIERARDEMERLNREQERANKAEARRIRRREALGRLGSGTGRGLALGTRGLFSAGKRAASFGAGVVGLTGVASLAGSFGSILALNHKTAEEYRLARQYGMSYRNYKTGSILAEQAGLNGENYGDLSEELSNKLGEQGNEKTINPLLQQIGILNKNALKGTKQQQFDTVMQKISKAVLSRQITAQQGESLADQLMGGEANKLMTYIIGMNKTYAEAMKSASELNNVTEQEARGALESSQTLSNLWTSAETTLQGVAGELGNALGPQLKAWEQQATAWFHSNKEHIVSKITDWVNSGGPGKLVDSFETIGRVVWAVAKKLEIIVPDANPQTDINKTAREKAYVAGGKAESEENSGILGLPARIFGGRKKFVDDYVDTYTPTFEAMLGAQDTPSSVPATNIPLRNQSINQNNNVNIVVHAQQGQSPEEIGQQIYDRFQQAVPAAPSLSGANTFDSPNF
ncbi:hypothetical protein TB147_03915 [Klebsiella aerogenes]|uniref:hypothetical protein n=1 Tax=Klebsiella aerogenes TaxID=548 RepID=UPI002E30A160|nr:hypothetical protein [Klebsiella aerogenes]MED7790464.1 hypothetical protein [Klebsiella aerogenes]